MECSELNLSRLVSLTILGLLFLWLGFLSSCPKQKTVTEQVAQTQAPPSGAPPVEAVPPPAPEEGLPTQPEAPKALRIWSYQFADMGMMQAKYTEDGDNINPPLNIDGVPQGTKSLVLIMDDPDAPMGTWVHWVVFNIPPETREIAENSVPEGAVVGKNSWGRMEYGGPAPPSGIHRYFFKLYALDITLPLGPGASKSEVEKAMKGHILAQAQFVGKYTREK